MVSSFARIKSVAVKAGFLVLGLAVGAGVLTVNTSWASGVSVSSDANMMASQAAAYPLTFDASLENALVELTAKDPAATGTAATFYASYTDATRDYGTSLLSAAQIYSADYQRDPAGAKNAYVDSFAQARSAYFGKLEAARNTVVSELSGSNDVAKDMFVNEYNAARDIYGGQLETVKDRIAALQ